jgi:hypothetical protein
MLMGYLASRFDNQLLGDLGFGTFVGFSRHVAEKLRVKENSVKNWRDEFDGLNADPDRKRKGWDRKPTPSRVYMKMQLDSWTYEQLSGLANSVIGRSPDFTPQSVDELFAWAIAGKDSDTNGAGFSCRTRLTCATCVGMRRSGRRNFRLCFETLNAP